MIQQILVALLFVAALYYVGRKVYRSLTNKKSCSSGCGGCGVDFSKIPSSETKKA